MISTLIVLTTQLLSLVVTCHGHVGLYYPPARKYALDFLDSARTVHPCGMSSGLGPVTDLKAGSTFNVSWYLGYAHPGGFRLELLVLDSLGNINRTFSLTSPDGEFIGAPNITTTSYAVTLPNNVTSCSNCTIRLVRQALNWGPNYLFWSCADVNIVPANVYTPSCGGHGSFNGAQQRCQCENTYSGSSCEFNDDCSTSSDCGAHGQCIQITTYSYPQKQCFCQPGWFGLHCEKLSPITSVQFNASLYNTATLSASSEVKLFYRIMKDTSEIEVVLQGRTKSYLGLGWKSINKICKPFSLRYNHNAAQPEPEPEPEPEPKPTVGGVKGNLGSTPNSEPIPEADVPSQGAAAEPEATGSADVNGMDCSDIIIGAAVGQLSRIGDYYTGDRSTPRLDEFYGGTQGLTAAVGAESNDGLTTIIFRKSLQANELADNSVTNDLMTVIWAHGQTSSIGNFYSQDEIKYHSTNRGKLSLNFYEQQTSSSGAGNSPVSGSWADSAGCQSRNTCRYQVTWSLDVASDVISFSITTNQSTATWTAIAFTKEKKMENMDVYGAFIDNNNRGVTFDGWTGKRYAKPVLDVTQNIKNASVINNAGLLTFSFQRSRDTGDKSDWAFTDTDCYYFLFPVNGGVIINFKDLGKHGNVPIISQEKICISSRIQQGDRANSNLPSMASFNHVTAFLSLTVAALATFRRDLLMFLLE